MAYKFLAYSNILLGYSRNMQQYCILCNTTLTKKRFFKKDPRKHQTKYLFTEHETESNSLPIKRRIKTDQ